MRSPAASASTSTAAHGADAPAASAPGLRLSDAAGSAVTVSWGDQHLMTYTYRATDAQRESPRPYVHPVHTLGGDLVSLLRPHDHVWHKGIAWSLPNVGNDNFWGGVTYRRDGGYQQLANNGSMDHLEVVGAGVVDGRAEFEHDLAWRTQADATIVTERRRLTAQLADIPGAWVLRWDTSMTNVSGEPIIIGSPTTEGRDNAGYGGLFWRGPRSFTGGKLFAADGPGGEELRGTRQEWLGLTGEHDGPGGFSTVVIVDDRRNPRHPPQWFARSDMFGCLNPAPFFSEEYTFEPDSTLAFSYAVVIADGVAPVARAGELADAGRDALYGRNPE